MKDETRIDTSAADTIRRYARADRFALRLMIALTFAGFLGVQLALRDHKLSLIFGAICFIGIIARELYVAWIFRGDPPALEGEEPSPTWRGRVLHIAFVMMVWLIPDISNGALSIWSFVGALMSGASLGAYLWWQQTRLQR